MTKRSEAADDSYQALRRQLDELLEKLQDPDCDVDQAVGYYEQALALAAKLEQRLQTAENRITKVQAEFAIKTSGSDTAP